MEIPSSTVTEAARRVFALAREEAGPDAGVARVTDRVLANLRVHLGRWVGVDAFDALVTRACTLARTRHPSLSTLTWRPGQEPALQGSGQSLEPNRRHPRWVRRSSRPWWSCSAVSSATRWPPGWCSTDGRGQTNPRKAVERTNHE